MTVKILRLFLTLLLTGNKLAVVVRFIATVIISRNAKRRKVGSGSCNRGTFLTGHNFCPTNPPRERRFIAGGRTMKAAP